MLQILHLRTIRKELMHANLIPLVRNGLFDDLKRQPNDDFCDIPLVIPDVEKTLMALMVTPLETVVDHLFDWGQDDPDNYQMWAPTEELRDYYKPLRGPKSAK